MTLEIELLTALRGVTFGLMLVSACGGQIGERDNRTNQQEAGGGVAGASGQLPTGPIAEDMVGSWMLTELKEGGQTIPLLKDYSYNFTPAHREIELNYLVFVLSAKPDSLPFYGLLYRWSVEGELAVDGSGGCAFSHAALAEYPPFELLTPLSAEFCPDVCYAVRDTFERVVLSIARCELTNGTLTLASEDGSGALTLVTSLYDLSGILTQ